jgi:hypothetical protein
MLFYLFKFRFDLRIGALSSTCNAFVTFVGRPLGAAVIFDACSDDMLAHSFVKKRGLRIDIAGIVQIPPEFQKKIA